jgi:hypothetical protein
MDMEVDMAAGLNQYTTSPPALIGLGDYNSNKNLPSGCDLAPTAPVVIAVAIVTRGLRRNILRSNSGVCCPSLG